MPTDYIAPEVSLCDHCQAVDPFLLAWRERLIIGVILQFCDMNKMLLLTDASMEEQLVCIVMCDQHCNRISSNNVCQ